jgi:amino acid transporter
MYAVTVSSLFCALAYLNINSSSAVVFNWTLNLVNTGGFISWICCSIILIRFRKACDMQGVSRELPPIRSCLQPVGSWITLCAFTILCLYNGFTVFFPSEWSASSFLTAYVGLPLFIGIYFVHRIVHRQDP